MSEIVTFVCSEETTLHTSYYFFLENLSLFYFNPRRWDKHTLGIEHFCKGHDGDFIHIKNIFFDQQKVK